MRKGIGWLIPLVLICGFIGLGMRAQRIKGNIIINGFGKILGNATLGDASTDTTFLQYVDVAGNLKLAGTMASSSRLTGTDVSVTDSIIGVTGDFSSNVVAGGDVTATGNDFRFGSGAIISNSGDTLSFQDASEILQFVFTNNLITLKTTSGVTKVDFGVLDLETDVFACSILAVASTSTLTGVLNALSSSWFNGTSAFGDAVVDSTTLLVLGTLTLGAGAGTIADVAGTMTITEDTLALSGNLRLGDVVESFTESGDSVCSVVIGGTTYKIRP